VNEKEPLSPNASVRSSKFPVALISFPANELLLTSDWWYRIFKNVFILTICYAFM